MSLPSLIRPEYFDTGIEKTSNPAEIQALLELKTLASALQDAELTTLKQSIANRLAEGEAATRVAAPKSALTASERAAADIHKIEQRKCRRASSASEIVASMLQLIDNDIDFWRPVIQKIELPANQALSEQLLAYKVAFREKLNAFLKTWKNAA
jgi:hypothetical protein